MLSRLEKRFPWAVRDGKITWTVKFASISVALIVIIVVISRHWLGLDALNYTDPIGIAAILGLIGVIALSGHCRHSNLSAANFMPDSISVLATRMSAVAILGAGGLGATGACSTRVIKKAAKPPAASARVKIVIWARLICHTRYPIADRFGGLSPRKVNAG